MEVTLPYTVVVLQEFGPGDTVIALVSSDEAMTLQASLVVLQKDSYGRTLAVLLCPDRDDVNAVDSGELSA